MNKDKLNLLLDKIENPTIGKALLTTFHKLNCCGYKKALCSISGGFDSDIVLEECVSLRLPSRDVLWYCVCQRLGLVNRISRRYDGWIID